MTSQEGKDGTCVCFDYCLIQRLLSTNIERIACHLTLSAHVFLIYLEFEVTDRSMLLARVNELVPKCWETYMFAKIYVMIMLARTLLQKHFHNNIFTVSLLNIDCGSFTGLEHEPVGQIIIDAVSV
jgi:hypothetical protein